MNYHNFFQEKLTNLKNDNLYRQPKYFTKLINKLVNFCSNDYLALANNKAMKNAATKAIIKYGVGAMASRYVFSSNPLSKKLEQQLARLKSCDKAMIFGSGYLANIGIIPALVGKGDLIIADKLIHSSLIGGCKLSGATLIRFRHNTIEHCEQIIKNQFVDNKFAKCLIITETIFSMDGDLGKVDELISLAKKYHCLILSDDAHGLGIIKPKYQNYDFHLQSGTLSKAAGGYGGYVCCSDLIIDYLGNFAKTAIYSTSLPPATLASNLQAIKIISKDSKLGKKTLENANYFCQILLLPKPSSAIVPIIIGDAKKTSQISNKLKQNGFFVAAIRPPTVETTKSRLRITFCANHKKSDIKKLAELIKKYCDK
jgi:8-amino-7-oxononanoate synthase